MISYLTKLLSNPVYCAFYKNDIESLFVKIFFPFLISNAKEQELMQDDYEQFQMVTNDLLVDHVVKSAKSITACLAKIISRNFDAFPEFIINYLLQLLDFALNSDFVALNNDNTLTEQYPLLAHHCSEITLKTSKVNLVETCILSFCILSNVLCNIKKYPLLKAAVKLYFELNFEKLINIDKEIIRDRLCKFYGIYLQLFFNVEDKKFEIVIEYLIINLLNYQKHPSVAYTVII